jgi:predicted amidohydrolase YtcJ
MPMPSSADFVITHVCALTQNPDQPRAEAVAVRGQRIVFVGSAAEARAWRGPHTREIDGQGATLIPGFIDAHFHLLHGSLGLGDASLGEAKHATEAAALLSAHAAHNADLAWIVGRGLKYEVITTRQQLDAAIPDRPAIVFAYDYHTAWANTRALEMAGLLHGGEVTGPNSVIVRDASGTATGELRESGAVDQVMRHVPEPDLARRRALLQRGLKLLAQAGVTGVHNMDGSLDQLSLYAALEDVGELTTRVYVPYSVTPDTTVEQLAEAVEMRRVQGDFARGGAAKFFMDGVLESYTALMLEPYADLPTSRGDALYSAEHFNRMATECDRHGLQIFVHCCGDGAVRCTLDGYAAAQRANGVRDSRHRVEHIEVVHPDDMPRFKQLGVVASMQPLHSPLAANDGDVWPTRAGRARWPQSFAWRDLRNAGARLAFGSDWQVVTYDPLLGVYAALNRQPWQPGDPDQRQTLAETLASYTRDAAYAEFMENEKGQLKPGLLADMVLLSGDLESTPAAEVMNLKPVLTMVDGRVVYEG